METETVETNNSATELDVDALFDDAGLGEISQDSNGEVIISEDDAAFLAAFGDKWMKHGEYEGTGGEALIACVAFRGIDLDAKMAMGAQGVAEYEQSQLEKDEEILAEDLLEDEKDSSDDEANAGETEIKTELAIWEKVEKIETKVKDANLESEVEVSPIETSHSTEEIKPAVAMETEQKEVEAEKTEEIITNDESKVDKAAVESTEKVAERSEADPKPVEKSEKTRPIIENDEIIIPKKSNKKIEKPEAEKIEITEEKPPKVEVISKAETPKPVKKAYETKSIVEQKPVEKIEKPIIEPKKVEAQPTKEAQTTPVVDEVIEKDEISDDIREIEVLEPVSELQEYFDDLNEVEMQQVEELFESVVEIVHETVEQELAQEVPDIENVLEKTEVKELYEKILQIVDLHENTDVKEQIRAVVEKEIQDYYEQLEAEVDLDEPRLDEGTHERKRGMIVRIAKSISDFVKNQLHKLLGRSALSQQYQFAV